jgi:hypothetical protein
VRDNKILNWATPAILASDRLGGGSSHLASDSGFMRGPVSGRR